MAELKRTEETYATKIKEIKQKFKGKNGKEDEANEERKQQSKEREDFIKTLALKDVIYYVIETLRLKELIKNNLESYSDGARAEYKTKN